MNPANPNTLIYIKPEQPARTTSQNKNKITHAQAGLSEKEAGHRGAAKEAGPRRLQAAGCRLLLLLSLLI
eukprot:5866253-Alexandrium_andersonii.AAC.1